MFRKTSFSIIVLLTIIFAPATLFTKDDSSLRQLYNTIDRLLIQREYEQSIPLIEELLRINPNNANYNFKMSYAILRGYSDINPLPYLEKAVKNIDLNYKSRHTRNGAPIDALWYYSLELFYNYNYEEAATKFKEYKELIPRKHTNYPLCESYIAWCSTAPKYLESPQKIKIKNFYASTTLPQFYHSTLFNPDESMFLYTADKNTSKENYKLEHKSYNDDIYIHHIQDSTWSVPISLSQHINSAKREALVSVHPNGKQLIIFREDSDGGNLYYSNLLDSAVWSAPKKYPAPINSPANESHATLSTDGKTIYFTSDREGGYGGLDIYASQLQDDGKWGPAINLGPEVNTPYFEEGPHLQVNDNTLYFSSNRLEGLGDFDIYSCEIIDDTIATNVKNLGYPINTPHSDMFFKTSTDGTMGYYSTPCKSTNGEYDFVIIHFLEKDTLPNIQLSGFVVNEYNDTLKQQHVYLLDKTTLQILDSSYTDTKKGAYTFNVHSSKTYFAGVQHENKLFLSHPFRFAKYYTDYTFSTKIDVDNLILSDSAMHSIPNQTMHELAEILANDPENNVVQDLQTLKNDTISRTKKSITTPIQLKQTLVLKQPEVKIDTMLTSTEIIDTDTILSIEEISSTNTIKPKTKPINIKKTATIASNKYTHPDSLLAKGIQDFNQENYKESIDKITRALALTDTTVYSPTTLLGIDYLSKGLLKEGKVHESIQLKKQYIYLLKDQADSTRIKEKNTEIYSIYNDLWFHEEALAYIEKNIAIDQRLHNEEGLAHSYQTMARVLMQHNEQTKAIEYLQKGIELSKDQLAKSEAYNAIGYSHHQIKEYNEAAENYKKAIQIAAQHNFKPELAVYQNNMGNAYYDMHKHNEAIEHYKISLGLYQVLMHEEGLSSVYYNMGNIYTLQEEYTQAINSYTESIDFALKIKNNDILSKNYFAMMNIYKAIKNYPLALEYYKKYFAIASPLKSKISQLDYHIEKYTSDDNNLGILQTRIKQTEQILKYEKAKYEKELELLLQKGYVHKITRIALMVIGGGFLLLLLLLLSRFRNRKKYFKQLSQQNAEILQKQEEIIVQQENLTQTHELLEKLSIVASKTDNAVAIITNSTEFEWVNDSFKKQYTNAAASLLDFAYDDIERAHILAMLDTQQSIIYETKRNKDLHNTAWILCTLTPIVANDEIEKIIVLESDITAQKIAEQQIREQRDEIKTQAQEIEQQRDVAITQRNEIEAQKNAVEQALNELKNTQKKLIESEKLASLGNLVAGVSHEINTPVGVGIAASSSLRTKTNEIAQLFETKKMKQSDLHNYLQTTQQAASLIKSNLVRTGELIKSFKQVSVDEMTDAARTFNVSSYIQEICLNHDSKIKTLGIKLHIDCPENIDVYNYPGAFSHIITNMLQNSFMHAFDENSVNPTIQITVQTTDSHILITYTDNGKGMTDEVVQKVFNPFFTTNMQSGTGLGMNVVYNLITKKLGGDIQCQSTLNHGTTFTINLPNMQKNDS